MRAKECEGEGSRDQEIARKGVERGSVGKKDKERDRERERLGAVWRERGQVGRESETGRERGSSQKERYRKKKFVCERYVRERGSQSSSSSSSKVRKKTEGRDRERL
eukprot:2146263-Pleurochrysis_carterae.AAC.4